MKNAMFPGHNISNIVHHRRCKGNSAKEKHVKKHMEGKRGKAKS